jgi:hypothetical protein
MAPLTDSARRDLLEVLDDRHGLRSTIITNQIPVDNWHAAIGEAMVPETKTATFASTPRQCKFK